MKIPFGLIGQGALLGRAIEFCINNEIEINFVLLTRDDPSSTKNLGENTKIIEVNKLNLAKTLNQLQFQNKGIIFSINNSILIPDDALATGWYFFNIHNGLTQFYRGIGELCVLAAYSSQQNIYGATIHSILPGQEVDSGKIYAQKSFKLEEDYSFENIMQKSILNCQLIFEENIKKFLDPHNLPKSLEINELGKICTFMNSDEWLESKKDGGLSLGYYSKIFPKLESIILEKDID